MKLKILLALALVFSLVACGKDEPKTEKVVEEKQEEEKEDVVEEEKEKKDYSSVNDSDVLDGVFVVGDETFSLPMTLQEFLDKGFELESRMVGSTLPGNTSTSADITYDGVVVKVSTVNYEETAQPVEQTTVKSVAFDFSVIKGDCEIIQLAKGINCKSTSDEVLAAYGEPQERDAGSQNTRLTLEYYGERSYEESVTVSYYDLESGLMSRYAITNFED